MPKRKKPYLIETSHDIVSKGEKLEALINLGHDIREKERRLPISFNDFLFLASKEPENVFRNIFQLFHDMVHYYVPEGKDEYPESKDSSGFMDFDMNKLFVKYCEEPFFADRLFANRFISLANGFKKGIQNNLIYFFEGPAGSGKSTFLNNLLYKLEEYTKTPEGTIYKIYWKVPVDELPSAKILSQIAENETQRHVKEKYFTLSCPNNDHPILIIPEELRVNFLDELITDKKFKEKLFNSKEYEWVLKDTPCALCNSLYNTLLDIFEEPLKVYNMIYPRRVDFSRQFGKGISIFNPGDPVTTQPFQNNAIQNTINQLFNTDEIPYIYSILAFTNNGVLALMDIKENNVKRLINLHGIISDGVHKVKHIEEHIRSLFIGVINPEDKVHYKDVKSFQDRIINANISYILDYNTEIDIYKNKFGKNIEDKFLPRVLQNFGKIIISTRMNTSTPVFDKWLENTQRYKNYIDDDLLLLKMELYAGKIPNWLSDTDKKEFSKEIRKNLIAESENEGKSGVSGRQSLTFLNKFLSRFSVDKDFITMSDVIEFFKNEDKLSELIPDKFIDALNNIYEYNILEEVKEAIYLYNEAKMKRDIKNYLYALNFDTGETIRSYYTNDTIEITEEYYIIIETFLYGADISDEERKKIRKENHSEYITKTLAQEIRVKDMPVEQTEQFIDMLRKYSDNLKKFSLKPYEDNDHFKRCIDAYNTIAFNKFEAPLKKVVNKLISNLETKFGYSEAGALYIIKYVLENKLNQRFKNFKIG